MQGFPQSHTSRQSQLDAFTYQMTKPLPVKIKQLTDGSEALSLLAPHTQRGQAIIFFDEITWRESHDSDFLGKFKNAWDMEFKKNDKLIFVLCVDQ